MKTLFVVLGFIASILSVIISVTPLYKIAFFTTFAAVIFGLIALFIPNQKTSPKKSIQLVFLLTIIAMSLSTYKSIFTKAEVGNTDELIQKENQSEEDAIETLEGIEIDE